MGVGSGEWGVRDEGQGCISQPAQDPFSTRAQNQTLADSSGRGGRSEPSLISVKCDSKQRYRILNRPVQELN